MSKSTISTFKLFETFPDEEMEDTMESLDKIRQETEASRCPDCGLGMDLEHPGCGDNRKKLFVKALAEYLVGDQAKKSIQLQLGHEAAKQWAKLRNSTPLFGYPTIEEAERVLAKFLS